MASIQERRRRTTLETGRHEAVLSVCRRENDGRGCEDREPLRSRVAGNAVSDTPEAANSVMEFVSYDATPDGQKLLINTKVDEPNAASLSIILNWASEMES
jgi:hypothetical protein